MQDKKFIESLTANGISVMTDNGWEQLEASHKTIPYKIWQLVLENGLRLRCADNHIVFLSDYTEVFVKDLSIGTMICTEDGLSAVIDVFETGDDSEHMYDLQVNSAEHRYYTDGILSHNTTVTLDIIANAEANGSKVLFISAECTSVDLALYVERYPKFGNIQIFFPQEIEDGECPKQVLEEILADGWDIILIDSFVELQEIIKESTGMTRGASENYMLKLMYTHNLGKNIGKHYSSFLNIQQVTKGGQFVGSNKLKHMTTGMLEIRFVDEFSQDERYIVFSKNRRGHVGKQMFFDLSAKGDVVYDTERFRKTESMKELKKKEKDLIKKEGLKFDALFGLDKDKEDK